MSKDIFACEVGDIVRDKVTGFEGIITYIDEEKALIHTDVNMFGRYTPIAFTFHQLEIIDELNPKYKFN